MKKQLASAALLIFCCIFSLQCQKGGPSVELPEQDPGYFPIGVWLQSTFNAQAYKNAGINFYMALWNPLDQQQLDELAAADMKLFVAQNEFALSQAQNPLILGWMQPDEPDNAQWNEQTQSYDPCIAPSVIINNYNSFKASDPYDKPVLLNLGLGVAYTDWFGRGDCTGQTKMYPDYLNGYIKGSDIISFDIYPVNTTDIPEVSANLYYVAQGIDNLVKWSTDPHRPVWCVIETTKIAGGNAPTPAQVKAEVWMAIIHGATGIAYFCHEFEPFQEAGWLDDPVMLPAITKINTEITSLASIINSPSTTSYATVSSSNSNTFIDIITKKNRSFNYIFSQNMRDFSTTATFTVASGKKVEVIGENRILKVINGKFADEFAGYGTHLYKIK